MWGAKKEFPVEYPTPEQKAYLERDKLIGAALNAVAERLEAIEKRLPTDKLFTEVVETNHLLELLRDEVEKVVKHQGDLERAIGDQSATDYTDRTQDLDNRFKELSEKITLALGLTLNGIANVVKKSISVRRKR